MMKNLLICNAVAILVMPISFHGVHCYSHAPNTNYANTCSSRRDALAKIIRTPEAITTAASAASLSSPFVSVANAKEQKSTDSDVPLLKESIEALTSLLENWDKATIDCTYADVPRELLEAKNKEKLLEKASEFALFDKSTSVVSCKKTNRIVRDYIGATGKGPLVGAEKRLLRKNVVEQVDPDFLDDYFTGK